MEHRISDKMLDEFKTKMLCDEKSEATIGKYLRDIRRFQDFMGTNQNVTKEKVIDFKKMLIENYAPSSVNSMLAAINIFFKEFGWYDCIVKSIKIQRDAFRAQDRELSKKEYYRLLEAARRKKNPRLYYLMQTICATGIRVSELRFITVEALYTRRATVSMKGKIRTIILPLDLCKKLKKYIKEKNIRAGSIFITRNGRPMDRSNIGHEMKALSRISGVAYEKIFPHNLRHLFACVYYQLEKDLFRLADILGHSNVNTTRIYTQMSIQNQEKQIDMLKLVI